MKQTLCITFIFITFLCNAQSKSIQLAENITLFIEEELISDDYFKNKEKSIVSDICFIDEKPIYGTDFEIPTTKVKSIIVKINQTNINLDVSFMYDPNLYMLDKNSFRVYNKNDIYVITGSFSDGAGSYVSQWIINQNSSYRSLISNLEDIFVKLMFY